jgi:hypothetical protein
LLVAQPVASFGCNGPSCARHPLVVRAFETGKLAAIVDAGDPDPRDRSVLVAVPLITSTRRVVGVVAVHQMPFMAFQTEQLQQLFVLAGHLADMLFDRWSTLHEVPLLPAPERVHATVIAHMPTKRTWRGMPAVLAAPAEEIVVEDVAATTKLLPPPADDVVMNAAAQSNPAPAEKLVMESPVTPVAVTTPNDEVASAAAPAEDPVSETVPIMSPRSQNRGSVPPPAPDPNRIAALIRGAVQAPKAKVKGVAIGAVKPVPAEKSLRERVRAVAQTRSESSR